MDFYLRGKRDDASKICLGGNRGETFAGREAIMDLLAMSYMCDQKWTEAKKLLSDLLFTGGSPSVTEAAQSYASVFCASRLPGCEEVWESCFRGTPKATWKGTYFVLSICGSLGGDL